MRASPSMGVGACTGYIESMPNDESLLIADLRLGYRAKQFTPADIITRLMDRADGEDHHRLWISRLSRDQVMGYVRALQSRPADELPLYGIPFVVKDNIDLA